MLGYWRKNSLKIHYFAISDKDTVCNMTNHSYFNLGGDVGLYYILRSTYDVYDKNGKMTMYYKWNKYLDRWDYYEY